MTLRSFVLFLGLALTAALGGCSTELGTFTSFTGDYGARRDLGYQLPSIPIYKVPAKYRRQIVRYETKEAPGNDRRRYRVRSISISCRATARPCATASASAAKASSGRASARVALKREWPVWTPPAAMIKRRPDLAKWRGGMPGGPQNALGARALYLFNKGGDSGYRIHGTPEWFSIGKAMSSGCIRLMNQDIIDLYSRADVGAKVIVK